MSAPALSPRSGGQPAHAMALMVVLTTVGMLFAAFTAAILVRRTGLDWTRVALPPVLWLNTLVLIGSSVALETGRLRLRAGDDRGAQMGVTLAAVLGALFLAGQVVAWQELAAEGVFLPSSPYAAFVYILTGLHGVHLLAGLGALAWSVRQLRRGRYRRSQPGGLPYTTIYWHFVGGVWIYLLALLLTL